MTLRMHWGLAIAMSYAAFALCTVGFVGYAMTRDVELVSADYYARALAHDGHMQAVANADALGAALRAHVTTGGIEVRVPAAMASRVRGTATFYRASDARADRSLPLAPGADGAQVLPTAGLASGTWRLQLHWSADGHEYYTERTLHVP